MPWWEAGSLGGCASMGLQSSNGTVMRKGSPVMKYLFQFTIIGVITAIGELLNLLLPLPIPASIYGLVILFVALCTKIIRLDQVEHAADFFLAIMPILFVPPTVNLMNYWGILKNNLIGLLITCILSTMAVMGLTGTIAQTIMKRQRAKAPQEPEFPQDAISAMEEAQVPVLESEGVYEEERIHGDQETKEAASNE